jgi:branched-chain amino acid transport system ATP-binding protein
MKANPLLSVRDLRVSYGNIQAVRGISFDVREGEILALIGANGAGKSSTLRALSGVVPYDGRICFGGEDLRGISPQEIVAKGIVQVPEGRGIFGNLTVMENLALATWQRKERGEVPRDYDRVFSLFPRLAARRQQQGGTLSGGEQQMLAVARALMSRGRLLLLDEPSMGLSPLLVRDIFNTLAEINRTGTTILLVEQNANMALQMAARGCLLETGSITLRGSGKELLGNPRVREAYLGGTG